MTYRGRLTLIFSALAVIPVLVLGLGVRHRMTARLDADAARRVDRVAQALETGLARGTRATRARLRRLTVDLAAENRFRLAVLGEDPAARRWLLDWAGDAMRAGGDAMLTLQDAEGRIVSSGQFRNDFDRFDPFLPAALADLPDSMALVRVRTPDGSGFALASLVGVTVAGRRYTLIGGPAPETLLGPIIALADDEIRVALRTNTVPALQEVRSRAVPFLSEGDSSAATAWFVVTRDPAVVRALTQGVDRWLVAGLGVTLLVALLLATWLGRRVSQPLRELADATDRLDFQRLAPIFDGDRPDEIGALGRVLNAMTIRLHQSAQRIRETERRAAQGDLARQVNHDIKNGLTPIRNVLRHLAQVAGTDPAGLAAVYRARGGTLEASLAYLEDLARHYARLSPTTPPPDQPAATSLESVVADIAAGLALPAGRIVIALEEGLPPVAADHVVLRRIVENLVRNGLDALPDDAGTVTLSASSVAAGPRPKIRLMVRDTGRGMDAAELQRAFEDFYTTKPHGTGLGLSVVRRLLTDIGGMLRVESTPGQGTTFTVEIPAA